METALKSWHELAASATSGELAGQVEALYKSTPLGAKGGGKRFGKLLERFGERFGRNGRAALFSTPGRTEIGGNHTDHQHGCVLAGSVDLDIIGVAGPNGRPEIRVESEGFPGQVIPLDNLKPDPAEFNDSRALVRGIASQFKARGFPVTGFDACLTSNVLKGSGLSSSAAFEVMLGTIVNHLFAGGVVTPVETAIIGRYAENHFFGKPCGLMDQVACAMGGVCFIDFKKISEPLIRKVSFDLRAAGYALCIIDSGADHADMTDEYSPIPREMEAVAHHFGKKFLREVGREEFLAAIPAIRKEAGDRAVLRALHFYADNERCQQEVEALAEGNVQAFLALVGESGRSSHMYLQNVFPLGATERQDVGVTLGLCDELLAGRGAFRVHGGGFAGTVQAFVPLETLSSFKERMEAVLGKGRCHVLSIRDAGCIRVM